MVTLVILDVVIRWRPEHWERVPSNDLALNMLDQQILEHTKPDPIVGARYATSIRRNRNPIQTGFLASLYPHAMIIESASFCQVLSS